MTQENYDNHVKLAEAEREIAMRMRVYPRFVADGSMSSTQADRRINIMKSIAADYRAKIAADEPQLSL
jgi:hypothetical protein